MRYELDLADEALADVDAILEWSEFRFGGDGRDGYEALISAAFNGIIEDPKLPGSHERNDIRVGLRCLHLRSCRDDVGGGVRRIANPRHLVIYRCEGTVVQVVRLLHDAMDISSQIIPK